MEHITTSARLYFRKWTIEDVPIANQLWGDRNVTRFIDARGQLSEEQVRERLMKEIAMMVTAGVQYFPVFLLESNEFIGCCGLRPYKPKEHIYEFGIHLCPNQWGKGYATEAGKAMMIYAFDTLNAQGLFAGHNPKNDSSRRLLQKLGFRYTHDEYYAGTGLMHPSYMITPKDFTS